MQKRFKNQLLRGFGIGLAACLFVLALPAVAVAAGSVHVTGTVADQGGSGIQGVSVTATDPGGVTVDFGPSFTAADGSYQLDVAAGTYDLHFTPPSGSGLNPVVNANFLVPVDETLNVVLTYPTFTFSGTLHDTAGRLLPAGSRVQILNSAHNAEATVDAAGNFSMAAIPGQYQMQFVNIPICYRADE